MTRPPKAAPAPILAAPAAPPDLQKEVLEEKRFVTSRISETTRYLGFGLLATFYAIVSSKDDFPHSLKMAWLLPLKIMALLGIIAILLDYLQYVFGRRQVQNALDRKDEPYSYDKNWFSYRARHACFLAKQFAALAGWTIFILIIASSL